MLVIITIDLLLCNYKTLANVLKYRMHHNIYYWEYK